MPGALKGAPLNIPALAFAVFYSALVYGLFLMGTTRSFENALGVLVAVLATGIIAAGISSQIPNVLLLPRQLCDFFGMERD